MRALSGILILIVLGFSVSSCLNNDPDGLSFEQQWINDTTAIGSYLRKQNIPALVDASGVRFIIDTPGAGFPAKQSSSVKFKYTGKLFNGQVFEENTYTASVKNMIVGMQVGLALMPEGTKGRIYIPSGLAYGSSEIGAIPANSILIFEIEILDVVVTEVEKQRLKTDTLAIDEYLTNNSLPFTADSTGLRYHITELGTGAVPTLYDKVKVKYTGKIFPNGTEFFNGTNGPSETFDSRVINYIYGFQAGLTKLPIGSKALFYVPSGLGFGTEPVTGVGITVPANSNLMYEIELLEIVEE